MRLTKIKDGLYAVQVDGVFYGRITTDGALHSGWLAKPNKRLVTVPSDPNLKGMFADTKEEAARIVVAAVEKGK